ncbi:Hint domain-containing protein [Pseudoruegeria sp. HB172150]|uniref:Hint domain-containing protein n=1 Tax=Pseudoruegeria sp. HB172150 TaxID=2721164 RepID=UPI0015563820|nr:Hint domain-containing protein [Pseudoruegeria sp. HB172150]
MSVLRQEIQFDTTLTPYWTGDDRLDPIRARLPTLACLAAGTLVEADGGAVPADVLRPGHHVWTHKGGWRPVTRIAPQSDHPDAVGHLRAVRVACGVFGINSPRYDVILSSSHRVRVRASLLHEPERPGALIAAGRLTGPPGST